MNGCSRGIESQREKWVERQQREIERKVAQLPNRKHRKQLLEEEQKEYEKRKKKFDLSFEDARIESLVGNPTTRTCKCGLFDPEWMFGIRDGFDVVILTIKRRMVYYRARRCVDFFEGEKIICTVRKCAQPYHLRGLTIDSYVSATFYVIKTARTALRNT